MSRLNYRNVKTHYSYTVDETARLLGVHRNTVREWIKRRGLRTCDDRRPTLILGEHLAAFLKDRQRRNRQPCRPDEFFCLKCRTRRTPAGRMADYRQRSPRPGVLVGLCPVCERWMHRAVNAAGLSAAERVLDIRRTAPARDIAEIDTRIVNSDFLVSDDDGESQSAERSN